jgi:simple sugar transport system ATP-binding protein
MSNGPIVALENATKRYGGIAALENANFELFPGEIHALVGENGAGKSTLCKLIAGVVSPTEGLLRVDGHPVAFSAPKDASRLGISMVFQETSLVPQLTVAQNIVLGQERAFNSVRKVRNTARQALQRLNFNVDASQLSGALSAAKRQMVEIARAVLNDARVIIFDEPTAALTPEETEHLFDLMKTLRTRGVAMIFISHALEEALTNADRITVLRNGRLMITGPAADFDRARLIRHMIGEDLARRERAPVVRRAPPTAAPVLQVENLRMGAMVNNMSFSVFPGEITGIAGLIGSGRSEAAKVIMGHTKRNFGGGRIWLNGREVRYAAPAEAVADGVAYVSEDRKIDGFFETLDVSENIGLGWLAKFGRGRWVAPLRKMRALAEGWKDRLSIRGIGADQPALHLSGGNQQKVVIAKSLAQDPRLVIFDEPTRGVDVGAVAEIHKIIRDLADSGAGVVVISSYLPEILDLSDRILVAKSGTIAAEFARSEASAEKILQAAIH